VREPVRIVSDLHLGHQVSRIMHVEGLRPLLAGAGTVIFNGDTWQELSKDLIEHSARLLEELRELCREEGCDAIFLPGNHDPGWPGDGFLELAGGKVVVTHGDTLVRSGAPWKREVLLHPETVDELWAARPEAATDPKARHQLAREISTGLPVLRHSEGRRFFQRAWDAIHPPQRGWEMVKAWWGQPRLGLAYRDRYFPRAEFLIIGHFHWAGAWKTGNLEVINTGSFLNPGRAYWVEINGSEITYGRIDEVGSECRKGIALREWDLTIDWRQG